MDKLANAWRHHNPRTKLHNIIAYLGEIILKKQETCTTLTNSTLMGGFQNRLWPFNLFLPQLGIKNRIAKSKLTGFLNQMFLQAQSC